MPSNNRSQKSSGRDATGSDDSSRVEKRRPARDAVNEKGVRGAQADKSGDNPVGELQERLGNQTLQNLGDSRKQSDSTDTAGDRDETTSGHISRTLELLDRAGGHPLNKPARRSMEQRFGTNFSEVRIHDGPAAHARARELDAAAATVGSEILFDTDTFDPVSERGQLLLAHELAHVTQFSGGDTAIEERDESTIAERDGSMEEEARAVAYSSQTGSVGPLGTTPTATLALAESSWWEDASDIGRSMIGPARTAERVANARFGLNTPAFANPLTAGLGLASSGEKLIAGDSVGERVQGGLGSYASLSGFARMAGAPALTAEASMASGGAFATTGGALASGGALVGSGLAGWSAGRLLDEGFGAGAKKLHQGYDAMTGNRRPDNQYGDHSLSGYGSSVLQSIDRAATVDETDDVPDYKQTLGWKIAELTGW